jgi:transposase
VETNYHHPHRSCFDAYEAYVKQRWNEGCHNIQQLWREMKAQGYPHSDRALRKHLEPLQSREQADFPEASCLDHTSREESHVALYPSDHRLRGKGARGTGNHSSGK